MAGWPSSTLLTSHAADAASGSCRCCCAAKPRVCVLPVACREQVDTCRWHRWVVIDLPAEPGREDHGFGATADFGPSGDRSKAPDGAAVKMELGITRPLDWWGPLHLHSAGTDENIPIAAAWSGAPAMSWEAVADLELIRK